MYKWKEKRKRKNKSKVEKPISITNEYLSGIFPIFIHFSVLQCVSYLYIYIVVIF